MEFKTKRLILKEFREHSSSEKKILAKEIFNQIDDAALQNTRIIEFMHQQNLDMYELNFAEEFVNKESEESEVFAVYLASGNNFVGLIDVHEINNFNLSAEIGCWIGKDHRRKGYATEVFKEIIKHCFNDLRLNKLNVAVFSFDEPSNTFVRKMGFKERGVDRNAVFRFGSYYDINWYDLLRLEPNK